MGKFSKFAAPLAGALILLLVLIAASGAATPVVSAQVVTPAPVAATQLVNTTYAVTGTFYTDPVKVGQYDSAEVQYSMVFSAGEVNTTTVTLQYSNDGVHWVETELSETSETVNGFAILDVTGALWRLMIETTNDQDPVEAYASAVFGPGKPSVTIENITVLTATVP